MADVVDFPEPDQDDYDFYGDTEDEDDDESFDCAMDRNGNCGHSCEAPLLVRFGL